MPPRPTHHPSDSQELTAWKSRKFDEYQLDTLESLVHKVAVLERNDAVFKGKLAVVMILGSSATSIFIHILWPLLHK